MSEQYRYLDAFIDELRAVGKYSFTIDILRERFSLSDEALKKSLQRLKRQNVVAMVRKGFYVIVPPEYRANGIIPTSFYLNDLLRFLNRDYYVGLLNAAALYSSGHQQSKSFSVITEGVPLRKIHNSKVNINFFIKRTWNKQDIIKRKVDKGYLNISSPELTALDLVNYYDEVGGFNRVVAVLAELCNKIQDKKLVESAKLYDQVVVVQRLGYLLEFILEENELSNALYGYLESIAFYPTLVQPQREKPESMSTGNRWKIVTNIDIEVELSY